MLMGHHGSRLIIAAYIILFTGISATLRMFTINGWPNAVIAGLATAALVAAAYLLLERRAHRNHNG